VSRPVEAPITGTFGLARPVRSRLALTIALGSAAAGAAIGLLATSAWLLSRASEHPSIVYLGVAIVAVRFFAISRGLFRYGERLAGHDAAFRLLARTRVAVYERLEVLAPASLTDFRRADLLARVVHDVDTLQDLMIRVVPSFAVAGIVGGTTVAIVGTILPSGAAVLGLALLFGAWAVPWVTSRSAHRAEAASAEQHGELMTAVVDVLDGALELVAYGAVDVELARVDRADTALTRTARARAYTAGLGSGLTLAITGLAVVGMIAVGAPAVRDGRLDAVLFATLVLLPLAAFELVTPLPGAVQAFERVRASAARVFRVLDAEPVLADPVTPVECPMGPHTIRMKHVSAAYRPGARVLDAVDLVLGPGQRIALVGASGAGKSTLANVLERFVPYDGSVTLDGVELSSIAGDDVRRVVGLVAQDAHVFDTTVRENLLLARREASEEELRDALRRVRLLDVIEALPNGLDTFVGPDGMRLSGGQRQRLAVARAHLARFSVLVLDEPGEHLDPETADALTDDLISGAPEATAVLLITHRMRGLEGMDEIVVLAHGRIVERGTHETLTLAGGHYARMNRWQCGAEPPLLAGAAGT
jgi:thiol reductant ABC exporter CydC subunit